MKSLYRLQALSSHLPSTAATRLLQATRPTTKMSAQKLTIDSKVKLNSGYELPLLGYGVYKTPANVAERVTAYALKAGYRHVDSATMYANEAEAAEAILKSGIPREQIFFTTKVSPQDISYEGAKRNIEASLKKTAGLKYLDLVLLHAPYGGKEGRAGAWDALTEAVEGGKVRSIGVSNYGVHHLDELEAHIKAKEQAAGGRAGAGGVLSVNQVELHPWLARPDIAEWCRQRGVVVEAYCPLVRAQRHEEPALKALAKKHGKTPAQILVRWSLQGGFVPLPKSVTPSRIAENADLYDFELSPDDMKSLETGAYEPVAWDPTVSKD